MSPDRQSQPTGEDGSSVPVSGNLPWVDPYTDEVLAKMRAQGPLIAKVDELRGLADGAFIGSAIDTISNSATVYWHGPQPAAVNAVVSEALAVGITVNVIDAPFSAAQLSESRSRIRDRARELGISVIGHDTDGGGSTVHFRTTASIQAARDGLADYLGRIDQIAGDGQDLPAVAALYSAPGSPTIRISDQTRNPQDWAG